MLELLDEYEEEIVELLAHEAGGTRGMRETSLHLASDQAAEAATLPRRMNGEHAASNIHGKENIVQRVPQGVVTVIYTVDLPTEPSRCVRSPPRSPLAMP